MDPTSNANDPDKLSAEEARSISKKMLIGGLFFLPLLWLINAFYFRRHLRAGGDAQVRRFVVWSIIGGSVEILLVAIWYLVFSLQWTSWGVVGEKIALVQAW
jgi:presenilin enhancer 2